MQGLERRTELEKNFISPKIGQIRIEHQVIQNWHEAQITKGIGLKSPGSPSAEWRFEWRVLSPWL